MIAGLWLALALGAAQEPAGTYGWNCRVEAELGSGAVAELSQSTHGPGSGFAIQVDVAVRDAPYEPPAQSMRWHLFRPGEELTEPSSLTVRLGLRRRDRRGTIRIDHDGGTTSLPATVAHLSAPTRGWATLLIQNSSVLRDIWSSERWRLSVLDRRGAVQAVADGVLPPRASIEQAVQRLLPDLARKADSPAGECDELGPGADI